MTCNDLSLRSIYSSCGRRKTFDYIPPSSKLILHHLVREIHQIICSKLACLDRLRSSCYFSPTTISRVSIKFLHFGSANFHNPCLGVSSCLVLIVCACVHFFSSLSCYFRRCLCKRNKGKKNKEN